MRSRAWFIGCAVIGMSFASCASAFDVHQIDAIPVMSGGIGSEERAAMVAALPDYNLKITTAARRSGMYLANVAVDVRDARGAPVFSAASTGPWLLARLPAGTYELRLTYHDQTQSKTVGVPAQGKREVLFYWDVPDSQDLRATPEEREQAAR